MTLWSATGCRHGSPGTFPLLHPESRAAQILAREVPAWHDENACFSCHNNGDAARALFTARKSGLNVPDASLVSTLAWLERPNSWRENKGDPGFSDQRLANLQFALALQTAFDTGYVRDQSVIRAAAQKVAADQAADGSWPIDPHNAAGSPATYGSALATALAITVLRSAPEELAGPRNRAADWLAREPIRSVPGAAAMIFARIESRETQAISYLLGAQNGDGGWGPYPHSPSEPFDTALALLALDKSPGANADLTIVGGRQFLARCQNVDGSWPATTRPPGGESYAQRMSTTAWVTLALLATSKY